MIVRGIVYDSPLKIPMRQIIGSDETLVSTNQGDADGLNYVYNQNDQPVLSSGNSIGNASMAEYVISNNLSEPCLHALLDDLVREKGEQDV